MECPECGAELEWQDVYGYFAAHQSGEKVGDIYKCPNAEDETCDSCMHFVSGSFYTDEYGNLHAGYPC